MKEWSRTGWVARTVFLAGMAASLGKSGWTIGVGGLEGDFLAWGAGARALALGNAYVALADDASAAYWNPAGLGFAERGDVQALHAGLWEGTSYDFFGVAIPTLTSGTFGWFGSVLHTGGLERRDDENNVMGSGFVSTKFGTGLAFGWDLAPTWSLGASVKWLGRWLDGKSTGFLALDLGWRWQPASWGVVGIVLQHAASMAYGDTSDVLPRVLRLGVVMRPLAEWGQVVADVEYRLDGTPWRWRTGVESGLLEVVTARLGMENGQPSGGVGFRLDDLSFDYSGTLHRDLGISHRASMGLQWGEPRFHSRQAKAREAYDQALRAYGEAERFGGSTPEGRSALETALHALEEVVRYDASNQAAGLMLKWVERQRAAASASQVGQ